MPSPSRLPRTRFKQYNSHYSPVTPLRAPFSDTKAAVTARRRRGVGRDSAQMAVGGGQRWTRLDMNEPLPAGRAEGSDVGGWSVGAGGGRGIRTHEEQASSGFKVSETALGRRTP
jgi:hypothetical protein